MASSKAFTMKQRAKFPALSADKSRLAIEQGRPPFQLAHLAFYIHKDARPQGYQLPVMSQALQSARIARGTYTTG